MRVAVVACLCFGCSYSPPREGGGADPDAPVVKLDAPPVTECTPNESFCNGRSLATCNSDGTGIASSVACPLTCENAQCLAASNISDADQLACQGTTPPTFMPTGNAELDDNNGTPRLTCQNSCGPALGTSINGTIVKQSGNRDVALFCLAQVRLEQGRTLSVSNDFDVPAVFLVLSDVVIDGEVRLDGGDGNGILAAGDGKAGGGDGGNFVLLTDGDDAGGPCLGHGGGRSGLDPGAGGGGGGGNAAVGGNGGTGRGNTGSGVGGGGAGGNSCADVTFLVGGSGGGGGADGNCGLGCGGWPGGGGGGALQISTAGNFQLGATGRLHADGGDGEGSNAIFVGESGGGGGGAGGTFLIEGKGAVFTTNSVVQVRGGNGGASLAGNGGLGAAGGVVTGGVGANHSQGGQGGSGGGGSAGRLRINVPTSNPAACTGVQTDPTGVCTTGVLRAL